MATINEASAPGVRVEGLTKIYEESRTGRAVLADVSATFPAGQFTVLLGRSGSGKSTLLNLISGIDRPTRGEIWIGDTGIAGLAERERTLFRRRNIGFVFQFFNLVPTLSAVENAALPLELGGTSAAEARARAAGLLERVGLGELLDARPDRLSGGEQQRVAIARALVHDPLLLLADEPTGNLDEETGERVLGLLLELVRDLGKTMIMATHSLEIVPYADRVYRVTEGRLQLEARPQPARRAG